MQLQIALTAVLLTSLFVFPVMAVEADEDRKRTLKAQASQPSKTTAQQAGMPIHQVRSADWKDTDSIPKEFFEKKIESASF